MKRLVYSLIILGAAGYFGYRYWSSHRAQVSGWVQPIVAIVGGKRAATPVPSVGAPPLPDAPRGRRFAPPGVFYMLERVSVRTENGVIAVLPGEEVRLLERKKRGKLRVTTGRIDLELKAEQVTNDYDLAQSIRVAPSPPFTLPR